MPLRAWRHRQPGPARTDAGVQIARAIDPARRAVHHGRVETNRVIWVQRQADDRPPELPEGSPGCALVRRIHHLAGPAVDVLAVLIPRIHVMHRRHRRIHETIRWVLEGLVSAVVSERHWGHPRAPGVGAEHAADVREAAK